MTDVMERVAGGTVPTASLGETLGILVGVVLPTVAKGVIIRRPWVVTLAERLDLDRRAVRRLQHLRRRYGDGPLLVRLPVQSQALVLAADHVPAILHAAPEPFTAATALKRAALAHFQPEGVLISHGPARDDRRRFVEAVLDTPRSIHQLAERPTASRHRAVHLRPLLSPRQRAADGGRSLRAGYLAGR